jgi:hypothetical protein
MSQENKPFAHRGDFQHLIPLASTDIKSGDYVVMPRNSDPISRARLGAESRISPVGAAYDAQWGVGVVDSDFSTNTVGATLYATPTAQEALPVLRRGCFRLAINKTSGKVGDIVIYSSGVSGAQVFTLNAFRRDVAVGTIARDFSGATANDTQLVELFEKPLTGRDIHFWLSNRVLQGCKIKPHTAGAPASSQVNAGATGEVNLFMVKGKMQSVARVTNFAVGVMAAGGQSALRFHWVAIFSAFASWTNSGISAGMMIPITWNSNMIPVALVLAWSATGVSIGADRIMNIAGPDAIPNGTKVVDHGTWYL